ncbi:MAG: FliM/FliN family flagellar motor switch protein [Solirubrobacteraceae bacterium]|nr:FliM/FliN family flagellar motor switch protein [Solirubrobacteraceae bacterium]
MSQEQALFELTDQTLTEVVARLDMLAGTGAAEGGEITITPDGADPLTGMKLPAVGASVAYTDGVTGGNIMVMPITAARTLAARMMGMEQAEPGKDPESLDELELSAIGEAMNQMMAGAAAATGEYLGQHIDITPPDVRILSKASDAAAMLHREQHVTVADVLIAGTTCRLVQLVPSAFVLRMSRALESITSAVVEGEPLIDVLGDIPVRVWAELGRIRMPIGKLVGMPIGEVVALDHEVDDPIDIYVDGMWFATGRLVTQDDHVDVQIEQVLDRAAA